MNSRHATNAEITMPRISTAPHRIGRLTTTALLAALLATLSGCAERARVVPLAGAEVTPPARVDLCGTLSLPGHWPDGTPVNGLSDLPGNTMPGYCT